MVSLTAILTAADPYRCLHHLAQQLRRSGTDCRVIALAPPPDHGGPYDIAHVPDGGAELRHVLDHASTLHLVDVLPTHARLLDRTAAHWVERGARLVLQRDRPVTGLEARAWERTAARHSCPVIVTRPATLPGVATHYVPPFIPWWRGPWTPLLPGTRARSRRGHLHVFASCPGELREEPGLEDMIDLAERTATAHADVRVELVCRAPTEVARRRRRHADVVLDGGVQGLSPAGLEALAQGVPVISPLAEASAQKYGPHLPVYAPDALGAILDRLSPGADPDPMVTAWARGHCAPAPILAMMRELYCASSSSKARQPPSMIA